MTEIKSLTIEELKAALADMGEKPFRAGPGSYTHLDVYKRQARRSP